MLVLIRKQPHHSECAQVTTGCFQKMWIPYHQKFIWEHTHQFWRMAFLGSETKFLIRKKETIINGSGVFRAPGNHPHSIQVSIFLLKRNFNVNLPGEHFGYCLTWNGWDLTDRASQSFNCILTLCRTSFECLKELLWHEKVFLKTAPVHSSLLLPQQCEQEPGASSQSHAYKVIRIKIHPHEREENKSYYC